NPCDERLLGRRFERSNLVRAFGSKSAISIFFAVGEPTAAAEMSTYGGDNWAREAHHRKRRVDDLMLTSSSPSRDASSPSFKKLSNGKYACLVCPHNPILDTPLMLSVSHCTSL
ncbi:hypothetical protein GW17_00050896, partial [Ensete ventricosum]